MEPEIIEALRRNSGIRLTRDGVFWHRGGPVEHPRVQALFHRGIAVRADGEVVLTVGDAWCYVACEGVARFAEALRVQGERAILRLRGGQEHDATEAVYGYGPDDRVYAWLRGMIGPALLLRPAHLELLSHVGDDGALRLAGCALVLHMLTAAPGAAAPAPGGSERRTE